LKQGKLELWTVPEGKELASWRTELGDGALVVTNKGYVAITTAGDEEVVRAGTFDGEEPRVVGRMAALTAPSGILPAVDIDPAGDWLVYAESRRIYLRSLEDWESEPQLVGEHQSEIHEVRFHPDNSRVAAWDSSGTINLWSVGPSRDKPLRSFSGEGLSGVAFDRLGNKLAAFGATEAQKIVQLWQLNKPPEAEPLVLRRMGDRNMRGSFDPSSGWFITTGVNSVAFWPVHQNFPFTFQYGDRLFNVAFAPDGKSLYASGYVGVHRLFVESGESSQVVLARGHDVEADPLGRFVLVSGVDGYRVFVLPLDGGTARELEGFSPACLVWRAIAVDTQGRLAAAALKRGPKEEKVIRIWDLESGDTRILGPVEGAGDGIDGNYSSLRFLPDGRLLAYGDCGLWLWNLEDSTSTKLAEGTEADMALSHDGRQALYTRTLDVQARLSELFYLDLVAGDSQRLSSHGNAYGVAFDTTGKLAVSGGLDGVVRVGPVTGEEPHLLLGHEGIVLDVDVSPDGRWIASAGFDDYTIRLWPMPEGTPFHILPYEEILDRLRSVTNVRVVEDEASSTGYSIDYAPFPGWEKVPEW
jgi:WD40 repeat protein